MLEGVCKRHWTKYLKSVSELRRSSNDEEEELSEASNYE
jgi:hypothetical protein